LKEIEQEAKSEKDSIKKNEEIIKLEMEKRKFETLRGLKVNVIEIPVNNDYPKYWGNIFNKIKTSS